MTTIGTFTVRRVPLNFCLMHNLVGIWAEDGTDRWHCSECIDDGLYFAEAKVRLDREIHQANHRATRTVATCLFCNPGYVA